MLDVLQNPEGTPQGTKHIGPGLSAHLVALIIGPLHYVEATLPTGVPVRVYVPTVVPAERPMACRLSPLGPLGSEAYHCINYVRPHTPGVTGIFFSE